MADNPLAVTTLISTSTTRSADRFPAAGTH
jgi:hypothetical protein